MYKSCIYGLDPVEDLWRYAEVLGCKTRTLLSTYLGLPLEAPYRSKMTRNHVLEKIHKRLTGWKGVHLSKGGRVTLIKSVLASLPTYFLSLFVIPTSMANDIEKCQRDFLWGKGRGDTGPHLVAWEDVYKPKMNGGLGFKRIRNVNKALLSK